eukprot:Blabericola_migrator_1__9574@NODE_521_length_7888_cov_123_152538_g398_i0_p6_GENE_NODE_521_length_7888_cov_123_152538_g398_i0NODE_521_length_7888_cov_123_152538_g398_i0_p6_ORF_typecomplete_len193_score16_65_NODE_521_length_7888_cov_123_152538_g398_i043064884
MQPVHSSMARYLTIVLSLLILQHGTEAVRTSTDTQAVHLPGYGALESESSLLSSFDDSTIKSITPCTFYIKQAATCNPRALHGPCAYCKTKNAGKILGQALLKAKCPDKTSFVAGYEQFTWRLTDKKFKGGWRLCVVEEDPLATASSIETQSAGGATAGSVNLQGYYVAPYSGADVNLGTMLMTLSVTILSL